jgi:hypothetical protein
LEQEAQSISGATRLSKPLVDCLYFIAAVHHILQEKAKYFILIEHCYIPNSLIQLYFALINELQHASIATFKGDQR